MYPLAKRSSVLLVSKAAPRLRKPSSEERRAIHEEDDTLPRHGRRVGHEKDLGSGPTPLGHAPDHPGNRLRCLGSARARARELRQEVDRSPGTKADLRQEKCPVEPSSVVLAVNRSKEDGHCSNSRKCASSCKYRFAPRRHRTKDRVQQNIFATAEPPRGRVCGLSRRKYIVAEAKQLYETCLAASACGL